MTSRISGLRASVLASVSAFSLFAYSDAAFAQQSELQAESLQAIEINIPAQPLSGALISLARQSGDSIVADPAIIKGKQSKRVSGSYTVPQALDRILDDSGLRYRIRSDQSYLVTAQFQTAGTTRDREQLIASRSSTQQPIQIAQASDQSDDRPNADAENDSSADVIVVTGTNIRGIAPDSSPVRTFNREDIQISGAATAQDFIQTLPFNFGGGSNANIPSGLPNDNTAGGNAGSFGSFGSSVNLRGLGSGSTLVLLNGRRLAPASVNGDFADISMIPASALERVETLTDGASSIYGSDAVAGVVNFILRDDFQGLESSLRYGTGTQNGTPNQYRASVTAGNSWESGNGMIVYEFFDQDQLDIQDRIFASQDLLPGYLLPSQNRHSLLASVSQDLTSNLELFADFLYTNRDSRQLRTDFSGSTFQNDATSENINVATGGSWRFGSDWYLDFSGTYSEVETRNQSSIFRDRLRITDSNIWTADALVSGPILKFPAGDLKIALGGHFRSEALVSELVGEMVERQAERNVYAVFGEAYIPVIGPENDIFGANRLEINVSARLEDYSDFGTTANPKVGVLWSPGDGLNLRGSYSTSFQAPVLGRVGATDLTASAFSTSLINSVFGLTSAAPFLDDAVVLTVAGTSKDLEPQTSRSFTAGLDFNQQWAQHSFTFSTTWFDISFEGRLDNPPIPGNAVNFDAVNIAFANPEAFPPDTVVFNPTVNEITTLLEQLDVFGNPFDLDPFDAVAINNVSVLRNLSRMEVRGFDFDTSYNYELTDGSIYVGLDGTFLKDVKQQASLSSPLIDQVDTLFNPANLKLRARTGFSTGGLSGTVFVNYVDDYRVSEIPNAEPIEFWTTVDLTLSYDTQDHFKPSVFNDIVLRLAVLNLFDQDPPSTPTFTSLSVDGFDPTNASPLGRFISVEISKQF